MTRSITAKFMFAFVAISLISTLLWSPSPLAQPASSAVSMTRTVQHRRGRLSYLSQPRFMEWHLQTDVLSHLGVFRPASESIGFTLVEKTGRVLWRARLLRGKRHTAGRHPQRHPNPGR
jgi:hypothetical protein